jgi:hypothetical protein
MDFYPTLNPTYFSKAKHFEKWREALSDRLLTPMIRHRGVSFFNFEVVRVNSGQFFYIKRWFEQEPEEYYFKGLMVAYNATTKSFIQTDPSWYNVKVHDELKSITSIMDHLEVVSYGKTWFVTTTTH